MRFWVLITGILGAQNCRVLWVFSLRILLDLIILAVFGYCYRMLVVEVGFEFSVLLRAGFWCVKIVVGILWGLLRV